MNKVFTTKPSTQWPPYKVGFSSVTARREPVPGLPQVRPLLQWAQVRAGGRFRDGSMWKVPSHFFYFLSQMEKKNGKEKRNVGSLRQEEEVCNSHLEKWVREFSRNRWQGCIEGPLKVWHHESKVRIVKMAVCFSPATFCCLGADMGIGSDVTSGKIF